MWTPLLRQQTTGLHITYNKNSVCCIIGDKTFVYCPVPARWGLRRTTLAPGSDKTQVQGSFGPLRLKKNRPYTGPVLLRQGEPGTSQYITRHNLMLLLSLYCTVTWCYHCYHCKLCLSVYWTLLNLHIEQCCHCTTLLTGKRVLQSLAA